MDNYLIAAATIILSVMGWLIKEQYKGMKTSQQEMRDAINTLTELYHQVLRELGNHRDEITAIKTRQQDCDYCPGGNKG